jgi:hypothetical protein
MGTAGSAFSPDFYTRNKRRQRLAIAAESHGMRHVGFVARQAEKLGWSWGYWQFDGDFIVYDIRKKQWVAPIRDALLPAPRR